MSAEIGKQILEAIKAYVSSHVSPVVGRVDALAATIAEVQTTIRSLPQPEKGEKGDAGVDGHTPTPDELRALITPLIPAPVPGARGERGEPGERGEAGADGHTPSGDELRALIEPLIPAPVPGPRGESGEPGPAGDLPTDDQLRALIQPLIPAPIPGERGESGERGEPGAPGADGRTPTVEELRSLIEPLIPDPIPGERGERGADGKDGSNGKDGTDGRDALQLEILPAIDEARSHPRGTYARHAGGLWRSFEQTFGMRGWECIVDGIAEETETLSADGRTLVRTTRYSSGRTFERAITMAVVLDKGVYKSDIQYAPGDAVTWAGSVWIAQRREEPTPYGKPGTPGSGWRLAVKAGRDARL